MITISGAQLWGSVWNSFGLTFCVISGLIVDFKLMSHAPCNALNILPSLSSAIGKLSPQVYLWRMITCFVTGTRFMLGVCYYFWFSGVDVGRCSWLYKVIVRFATLFYFLEISSLLALSAISVQDDGTKHEQLFKIFLAMASFYMCLSIIAVGWAQKCGGFVPGKMERRMLYARVLLFIINAYSAREAWVDYEEKVKPCIDYGYTWFATYEYISTACNILSHSISIFDFRRYSFAVVQTTGLKSGAFCDVRRDINIKALRV